MTFQPPRAVGEHISVVQVTQAVAAPALAYTQFRAPVNTLGVGRRTRRGSSEALGWVGSGRGMLCTGLHAKAHSDPRIWRRPLAGRLQSPSRLFPEWGLGGAVGGQDTRSLLLVSTNRPITAAKMTRDGGTAAVTPSRHQLSGTISTSFAKRPVPSGQWAGQPAKALQRVPLRANVQTRPNS